MAVAVAVFGRSSIYHLTMLEGFFGIEHLELILRSRLQPAMPFVAPSPLASSIYLGIFWNQPFLRMPPKIA
jgi:hypothetical protein